MEYLYSGYANGIRASTRTFSPHEQRSTPDYERYLDAGLALAGISRERLQAMEGTTVATTLVTEELTVEENHMPMKMVIGHAAVSGQSELQAA